MNHDTIELTQNAIPQVSIKGNSLIYNSCFQLIINYLLIKDQLNARSLSKRLVYVKQLFIQAKLIKADNIDQFRVLDSGFLSYRSTSRIPASNHLYSFKWIKPINLGCLEYLYSRGIRLNYDLTCFSADTIKSTVDLSQLRGNLNISKITEIELPNTMYVTTLICDNCDLFKLPELPNLTGTLDCTNNIIDELPELPNLTGTLKCGNNLLESLPNLDKLTYMLKCNDNQLEKLPNLPNLIYKLDCSTNLLLELPELPNLIFKLYCYCNDLRRLPEMPNFNGILNCYNNDFRSFALQMNCNQETNTDWETNTDSDDLS